MLPWIVATALGLLFLIFLSKQTSNRKGVEIRVDNDDILSILPDSIQDKLFETGVDEKPATDDQISELEALGFNVKDAWCEHIASFAVFAHKTTCSFFKKTPNNQTIQCILYGMTGQSSVMSKFYRLYLGKGNTDKLRSDLMTWVQKEVDILGL